MISLPRVGTPSEAFLAEINVKGTALRYMRQHAGDAVPSWAELIPDAPSAALDLVGRMLRFDFRDRLSVEDALAHSFLAGMDGVGLRWGNCGGVLAAFFLCPALQ